MKIFEKNLMPLVCVILLVLSVGLSYYSTKITIHGFKIFLPELILLASVLLGIVQCFLTGGLLHKKYALLSLLVLGLMTISSFLSIKPVVSFKETLRWAEMFAAFFFTLSFVKTARQAKIILIVIILMGLFHFFWGLKSLDETGVLNGFVSGYFENPNQLALYFDFVLPLIAAFFFAERKIWWKIWWVYCFLFIGVGLYMTQSRGGWVSNVLVLLSLSLIFLFRKTGKGFFVSLLKRTISASFVGMIILFFILLFFVSFAPGLTERVMKRAESGRLSDASSRLYYYVTGYQVVEDFPLTGIGGNLLKEVVPYYYPFYGPKANLESFIFLHNLYLKMAAENGLLTFLAFLLFLSHAGRDLFSFLTSRENDRYWLVAGAGGSVLAWLLHNMVDEGFSFMAIQWGILLGLALSLRADESNARKVELKRRSESGVEPAGSGL